MNVPSFQWDDVDVIKLLGSGSYGDVFKVQNKKTKQIFARKVLKSTFNQNEISPKFAAEVNALKMLNYPTLVSLYSYSYSCDPPYFDTEIIENENGSLYSYISKAYQGKALSGWNNTHKFIIILGVALGIQYCHSKDICHRDISPSNILLLSNLFPYICDFGMSKIMEGSIQSSIDIGSPGFIDPAVIKNENGYNGKAADIFSLGMLIYCILYDQTNPFPELKSCEAIIFKIANNERPELDNEYISDSMNELIEKCWNQDPSKRPNINEIVQDLLSHKVTLDDVNNEEVDEFLKFCHESSYLKISFLKDNFINPNFINVLKQSKNPQLILFNGSLRVGKSSILNQIINGPYDKEGKFNSCLLDEPFITDDGSSHVANGCEIYGPISFKKFSQKYDTNLNIEEDFDIFFVDTQGFYGLNKHSANLFPSLLTLLQVSTISIFIQNNGIEERSIGEIINNIEISNFLDHPFKEGSPIIYQNNFILDRKKRKDASSFEMLSNYYLEENQNSKQNLNNLLDLTHDPNLAEIVTKISIFTGSPFVNEFTPKQDDENLKLYWTLLKNFVQNSIIQKLLEVTNMKENSDELISNIQNLYNIFSNPNIRIESYDQNLFRSVLYQLMTNKLQEISNSTFNTLYESLIKSLQTQLSKMIILVKDKKKIKERIQELFKPHEFLSYQRIMNKDFDQFLKEKINYIQVHLKKEIDKIADNTITNVFAEQNLLKELTPYVDILKQCQFQDDIPVEYTNEKTFNDIWMKIYQNNETIMKYYEKNNKKNYDQTKNRTKKFIMNIFNSEISRKPTWNTFHNNIEKEIEINFQKHYENLLKESEYLEDFSQQSLPVNINTLFSNSNSNNKNKVDINNLQNEDHRKQIEEDFKRINQQKYDEIFIKAKSSLLEWDKVLKQINNNFDKQINTFINREIVQKDYYEDIDKMKGWKKNLKRSIILSKKLQLEIKPKKKKIYDNLYEKKIEGAKSRFSELCEQKPKWKQVMNDKAQMAEDILKQIYQEIMSQIGCKEDFELVGITKMKLYQRIIKTENFYDKVTEKKGLL